MVVEIRHMVRREVTPEDLVVQVERDLEVLVRSRRKASVVVGVRRSGSAPCRLRQMLGMTRRGFRREDQGSGAAPTPVGSSSWPGTGVTAHSDGLQSQGAEMSLTESLPVPN